MNYHIMVDDKFLDSFIEDMEELNFLSNNRFYVRADIKNRKHVFSQHCVWISHDGIIDLLKSATNQDKVYVHGYDFYMGDLCLKFLKADVELNVILWGGEFFQDPEWYHLFRILENKTLWKIIKLKCGQPNRDGSINFFKNIIDFLRLVKKDYVKFKKKKIQVARIDHILLHKYDLPDVKLVETIYKNKFKKHIPFFYSFNFDYALDQKIINNTSGILRILVGNSFNHSNNHFDAFVRLKKILKGNYEINCPLSYGESVSIKDLIIRFGNDIFGRSFHPVVEFMKRNNYVEFLSKMDAAYFYHIRSQAAGNIITMLSLGKPVFMNKKSTLYQMFKNLNISGVYSTEDFKRFIEYRSEFKIDLQNNSILLEKYFSKEIRLHYLREAFIN